MRRGHRGVGLVVSAPFSSADGAGVVEAKKLGTPVIFQQERPGRHGKPFVMYKFRTMTDARAADGTPLHDSARLTPLGAFYWKSSLDELPNS